jgi:hypothetical protein
VFPCDLNRDGKQDLVISYSSDYPLTTLLLGKGDGGFTEAPGSPFNFAVWAVADFNHDGTPDLLDAAGQVRFGRGEATFSAVAANPAGAPCSYAAVADVDGDSIPDLVCEDGSWGVSWATIYRGDGNGGFIPLAPQENLAWDAGPGPEFADFSGDGIPDVLLARDLLLGNGRGDFTPAAALPNSGSPLIIDVNGDGKPDILVADGTHRFSVFLNNSGGLGRPRPPAK